MVGFYGCRGTRGSRRLRWPALTVIAPGPIIDEESNTNHGRAPPSGFSTDLVPPPPSDLSTKHGCAPQRWGKSLAPHEPKFPLAAAPPPPSALSTKHGRAPERCPALTDWCNLPASLGWEVVWRDPVAQEAGGSLPHSFQVCQEEWVARGQKVLIVAQQEAG